MGPRAVVIGLSALWLGASAGAAPAAGAATATFGKTTVGASSDYFVSERKRMNAYALAKSSYHGAARLVPETAMQWGIVAIVSSFVMLGIGAMLSLRKHPPEAAEEASVV